MSREVNTAASFSAYTSVKAPLLHPALPVSNLDIARSV